ncbi:MAG: glycosyltransferase, partial [Actinomycetota bacterium]|nr:glycosyltransferase [Actinomycetota bacterium]
MARYLMYSSPARGHLYPVAATLVELQERGHEVHVRTLASEVPALEGLGLHAEAIDPEIEALPLDDWKAKTPEEALARTFRRFGDRAVHEVPDLKQALATVEPDALVIDITTVGAMATAEKTGLPWAQTIPFFQHFSLGPTPSREVSFVPFSLDPAGTEVMNEPRVQLGLEPLAGPDDMWRASLHLYYTAPPFESPGLDLPPSVRMVGPGLWEPPAEAPAWSDELEDPLVLVGVSSEFQRDDALIQTALDALRSEDGQVVVTTAAHDPERFDVPPNARVERWLPHSPLLEKAACVVCHGGMGVTQKALAAGVPVCVVPFERDQFEVAQQVIQAG